MVHIFGQAKSGSDVDVIGVLPAKQRRGQRTRDRLLSAGHRLVAAKEFDSMSVADIARAADCSVGVFYQRFRDKDAFFRALVAHYVSEAKATTLDVFATHTDDQLIEALVVHTAQRFRRYSGLLRSAIRKRMEDATIWEPIRLQGHFAADCLINRMRERRRRAISRQEEVRIRFAFQVLYGTLNNALVNEPGPLEIDDAEFLVQLERAFRLVLFSSSVPSSLD